MEVHKFFCAAILGCNTIFHCLLSAAVLGEMPERIPERGLILFTLPIITVSAILPPWVSFIAAGLGGLVVAIVETVILGHSAPSFITIVVLSAIAFISYLSNANKESALDFVQKANAQLDAKLKTQQQDLLQIVNDISFLPAQ